LTLSSIDASSAEHTNSHFNYKDKAELRKNCLFLWSLQK
jgi:hypothetical protein